MANSHPIKECSCCKQSFPADSTNFNRNAANRDGLHHWCKPCHRMKQSGQRVRMAGDPKYAEERRVREAMSRSENPLLSRRKNLWTFHRMTLEQYDAILASQGGVCAICKKEETRSLNGKETCLAVDHDSSDGRSCQETWRGLLCFHCNAFIGKFKHDAGIVLKAKEHLNNRAAEINK